MPILDPFFPELSYLVTHLDDDDLGPETYRVLDNVDEEFMGIELPNIDMRQNSIKMVTHNNRARN